MYFWWNAKPTGYIEWLLSTKPGRRLLSARTWLFILSKLPIILVYESPGPRRRRPCAIRAPEQKTKNLHVLIQHVVKVNPRYSMYGFTYVRWKMAKFPNCPSVILFLVAFSKYGGGSKCMISSIYAWFGECKVHRKLMPAHHHTIYTSMVECYTVGAFSFPNSI